LSRFRPPGRQRLSESLLRRLRGVCRRNRRSTGLADQARAASPRRLIVMFRTVRPDASARGKCAASSPAGIRDVPPEESAAELYARYAIRPVFTQRPAAIWRGVNPLELLAGGVSASAIPPRPSSEVLAASAGRAAGSLRLAVQYRKTRARQDVRIRALVEGGGGSNGFCRTGKRQRLSVRTSSYRRLPPRSASFRRPPGGPPRRLMGIILSGGVQTVDDGRRGACISPAGTALRPPKMAYRPDAPEASHVGSRFCRNRSSARAGGSGCRRGRREAGSAGIYVGFERLSLFAIRRQDPAPAINRFESVRTRAPAD